MKTHVTKWGKSSAIRIPKSLAEAAGLRLGDEIVVASGPGCIVFRAVQLQPTLEELVAGITPKNRHREIETGKSVGNEGL